MAKGLIGQRSVSEVTLKREGICASRFKGDFYLEGNYILTNILETEQN